MTVSVERATLVGEGLPSMQFLLSVFNGADPCGEQHAALGQHHRGS